jgi:phosphatidylglycerophosphate synthase
VVAGLLAGLIWHAAYCCDCADGQLARLTGTATPAGARLDILCDIAVQVSLVAAVVSVATTTRPGVPPWFVAVFAGSWMVNLVTSVLAKEGANTSLISSASAAVRLLKLTRDYGFMLTSTAAVLVARPAAMFWVMVFFSLVNCGFLVAGITQAAHRARPADPAAPGS